MLLALACTAQAPAQVLDRERSHARFDVRTRLGPRVQGQLPVQVGRIEALDDGRVRVSVTLDATRIAMDAPRHLVRVARGPQLFDVARHPTLRFVSDPVPPSLVATGGALPGQLEMRGATRPIRFSVQPAACAEPGRACAVIAHGQLQRDDYGLTGLRWALADRVRIHLHVHFEP